MNRNMRKLFSFIIAIASLWLTSCGFAGSKDEGDEQKELSNYDLKKPERFTMPGTLLEISGISFYKGKNDTVYSIQDEEGKLFRMAWSNKKQYHSKFGKRGDYEDVGIAKDKVVVLKSNGGIYVFDFADAVYEEIDSVQEWKGLLPEGEYEGLYADDATGNVYVLCKNCPADNNKDNITGYVFQLSDSLRQAGTFSIDVASIKPFTGKVKKGFRPSALTKNPVTGEWFIVSAINKLLVVTDAQFKVKGAYPLNGNMFHQAEGIAFDSAGNMYISNEGDDLSEGNILKFVRKGER